MKFLSNTPEETLAFAEKFAKLLKIGDIIAFYGDLGAGKTTFVRGLALGLGLGDVVNSPTFSLVNEYRPAEFFGGANQKTPLNEQKTPLFHFDMYRIKGDPADVGIDYYLSQKGIIVIEWYENVAEYLDANITVSIKSVGETEREIEIIGGDLDDFGR
jgi:tRNA threonylcarbamoyladenosine biosynthesis protein TsaE